MSALIKTAVKTILWGAGGLAATCLALLIVFQEKLVYVPELPGVGKAYPYTPARLHMLYEDVWLKAKDGTKLHCWLIKNSPDASGHLTLHLPFPRNPFSYSTVQLLIFPKYDMW